MSAAAPTGDSCRDTETYFKLYKDVDEVSKGDFLTEKREYRAWVINSFLSLSSVCIRHKVQLCPLEDHVIHHVTKQSQVKEKERKEVKETNVKTEIQKTTHDLSLAETNSKHICFDNPKRSHNNTLHFIPYTVVRLNPASKVNYQNVFWWSKWRPSHCQ